MLLLNDATTARRALRQFDPRSLPEDMRDRFEQLQDSPSPVDQIVGTAELIYARRAEVNNDARDLAAGLASFATLGGWHGLAVDGRGEGIAQALWRDNGEKPIMGRKWPAADSDPVPLEQYKASDATPTNSPSSANA